MTEEIISEVKILDSENLLLVLKRGGDISYQHGNKVTAVSVATQVLINVTIPNQPIRRRVRNDVT